MRGLLFEQQEYELSACFSVDSEIWRTHLIALLRTLVWGGVLARLECACIRILMNILSWVLVEHARIQHII